LEDRLVIVWPRRSARMSSTTRAVRSELVPSRWRTSWRCLRGIDPQEGDSRTALDGIRRFIDNELHDEDLAKAFENARNRDLFLWRGVDREY
jgi:hypothetical protein